MFYYTVTFIHEYWHITTTVEVAEFTSEDDIIEMAQDWIHGTSGLNLDNYRFVDIEVDYAGVVDA